MSETGFGDGGQRGVPPPNDVTTDLGTTQGAPAWATGAPVPGDSYAAGAAAGGSGGSGTATVAADQARQVASTAGEGAREVAGEAREQARQVAGEAKDQARQAVRSAQGELRSHASQQTDRAAQGLQGFASQIQALVEGRADEAGRAGDLARQAGDRVNQLAERLQSGGFDGVVEDMRSFARRRPGLFLVGAAAAGFAAGRMIRASREGGDEDEFGAGDGTYRLAGTATGTGVGAGYPSSSGLPATAGYPPAEYATGDYVPAAPAGGLADDDVLLADPDFGSRAPGGGTDAGIR